MGGRAGAGRGGLASERGQGMTVVGERGGEGKSSRQRRSYGARVGTGMSYVIFLRDILTGVPSDPSAPGLLQASA